MDPKEAARALKAAGLLRTESNSRLTVKQRIPGHDRPRVYQVLGAILDGAIDGEDGVEGSP